MTRFSPALDRPPLQALLWRRSGDPWQVAVACQLNLTGRPAVDTVWPVLLERWPDAHALARADPGQLLAVLSPLGLGERRTRALIRMSTEWDQENGCPTSTRSPLELTRYHGLGGYAQDSHTLYVRGDVRRILESPVENDHVIVAWARLVAATGLSLCVTCRRWSFEYLYHDGPTCGECVHGPVDDSYADLAVCVG